MVRLLAVKASIAALRRAISLSDRLKPATWELLAIFCAALFVLSVWGYKKSEQPRTQPDITNLALTRPTTQVGGGSSIVPHVTRYAWEIRPAAGQSFSGSVTGTNFASGAHVVIFQAEELTVMDAYVREIADPAQAHLHFQMLRDVSSSVPASAVKPFLALYSLDGAASASSIVGIEDARFGMQWGGVDIPGFLRSLRQGPTVIYQTPPENGSSPWKQVMFWAPLFGMIVSPLVGLGTLMLSWIALRRKWAEQKLLDLQVLKVQLEVEELRRKREEVLREATKSRILTL